MTKQVKEFVEKIPQNFYPQFIIELKEIFPEFELNEDWVYNIGGTQGWSEAMYYTCKYLGYEYIKRYWDNLSWDVSDYFDELIGEKLLETRN